MAQRGRPIISVRLPKETFANVKEFSAAIGFPNSGAFVREMLICMTSGDYPRLEVFQKKLFGLLSDLQQSNFLQELTPGKDPARGTRSGGESGVRSRKRKERPPRGS